MIDEQFRTETLDNVERFYDEASNPDFDIQPTLLCLSPDDEEGISIYTLNAEAAPMEQAVAAYEYHCTENGEPVELALVAAVWHRSPEDNEIVGEAVLVIFETKDRQDIVHYTVTRNPTKLKRNEPPVHAAVSKKLLYNPQKH